MNYHNENKHTFQVHRSYMRKKTFLKTGTTEKSKAGESRGNEGIGIL